jgi:hypothetical protein
MPADATAWLTFDGNRQLSQAVRTVVSTRSVALTMSSSAAGSDIDWRLPMTVISPI